MNEEKTLVERLLDPLPAALWAVAGAILAHLWRRYRDRMVTLRWQVWHHPLAIAAQDAMFGTIEVRYNGNPVQNLLFTTVDIQNDSNRDLTNLDLNFFFTDGTLIFMSHGAVLGSANVLAFAEPFASELQRLIGLPPEDPQRVGLIEAVTRRRDYRLPALNRGATARIGMLIQGQAGQSPTIQVATDHPGVKLAFRPARQVLLGVDTNLATLIGLVTGIAVLVVVSTTPLDRGAAIVVAFGLGSMTMLVGALLVRAFNWVRRFLG